MQDIVIDDGTRHSLAYRVLEEPIRIAIGVDSFQSKTVFANSIVAGGSSGKPVAKEIPTQRTEASVQ